VKARADDLPPFGLEPFPDEALASLIGRAYFHSGENSPYSLVDKIYGGRRSISVGLPGELDLIATRFAPLLAWPREQLIDRFTTGTLHRPFLSDEEWDVVVTAFCQKDGRAVRMRLGHPAGGFGFGSRLHCSQCALEQAEQFGYPYWCVRFALPLVAACPQHCLRLSVVPPVRSVHLKGCRFLAPPTFPWVCTAGPSGPATSAELRLARLVMDLRGARMSSIARPVLRGTYLRRMKVLGLVERGGRVRRHSLWKLLQSDWGGLPQMRLAKSRTQPAWLSGLYNSAAHSRVSIAGHLLTIGTLFLDAADWMNALQEYADHDEISHRPPTLAGTRFVQVKHWLGAAGQDAPESLEPDAVQLFEQGKSVREVANATGRSTHALYRSLRKSPALAGRWALAALQRELKHRTAKEGNGPLEDQRSTETPAARRKWLARHRDAAQVIQRFDDQEKGS